MMVHKVLWNGTPSETFRDTRRVTTGRNRDGGRSQFCRFLAAASTHRYAFCLTYSRRDSGGFSAINADWVSRLIATSLDYSRGTAVKLGVGKRRSESASPPSRSFLPRLHARRTLCFLGETATQERERGGLFWFQFLDVATQFAFGLRF